MKKSPDLINWWLGRQAKKTEVHEKQHQLHEQYQEAGAVIREWRRSL